MARMANDDRERTAREGLVLANYGRRLLVEDDDGNEVLCSARKSAAGAVCGDRIQWRPQPDGTGVVLAFLPRSTVLARPDDRGGRRPVCANIDQIVAVTAVRGDGRIAGDVDAYVAAAELLGIDAVLLVNKIDLARPSDPLEAFAAPYRAAGYDVLGTSTLSGEGMDALRGRLRGRRSVLVGASGVGKSSLSQVLIPDREIRIGALSADGGHGRHTTTASMLFHLPGGGDIIDSPGVREFRLGFVPPPDLARAFREIRALSGKCRYRDCRHAGEPGCAVSAAVGEGRIARSRYEAYLALLGAMEEASPRGVSR